MRNFGLKVVLIATVAGAMLVTGCSTGNSQQTQIENVNNENENHILVEHVLGTTQLESVPKKIVVLEYSYLDALYRLGITPIAIADDNDISKVEDITKGESIEYISLGNRREPDIEALSMLDADLIIAEGSRHSEMYEEFSKIAPTVVFESIGTGFDEYKEYFMTIAKALEKEEEGHAVLEEVANRLAETRVVAEEKLEGKVILTVSPKNEEYTAHTSSSFVGELLEEAGFKNAIQSDEAEVGLSLEQLVEINPDVIVYMREDIDTTIYEQWKETELYKSLKAVQNENVFTTVDRKPWTQYRSILSTEVLIDEMTNWLLQ